MHISSVAANALQRLVWQHLSMRTSLAPSPGSAAALFTTRFPLIHFRARMIHVEMEDIRSVESWNVSQLDFFIGKEEPVVGVLSLWFGLKQKWIPNLIFLINRSPTPVWMQKRRPCQEGHNSWGTLNQWVSGHPETTTEGTSDNDWKMKQWSLLQQPPRPASKFAGLSLQEAEISNPDPPHSSLENASSKTDYKVEHVLPDLTTIPQVPKARLDEKQRMLSWLSRVPCPHIGSFHGRSYPGTPVMVHIHILAPGLCPISEARFLHRDPLTCAVLPGAWAVCVLKLLHTFMLLTLFV